MCYQCWLDRAAADSSFCVTPSGNFFHLVPFLQITASNPYKLFILNDPLKIIGKTKFPGTHSKRFALSDSVPRIVCTGYLKASIQKLYKNFTKTLILAKKS